MPPPPGNRQGEVDGCCFGEWLAKFRPGLRHSVTLGLDPRLTPWIARCLPLITHRRAIDREVRLLCPFESPREGLLERGGSTVRPPDPI